MAGEQSFSQVLVYISRINTLLKDGFVITTLNGYDAKWDICQWKIVDLKRKDAENKLSNHISLVHRKGKRDIKKQKLPTSPDKLPPNLPKPIKEN